VSCVVVKNGALVEIIRQLTVNGSSTNCIVDIIECTVLGSDRRSEFYRRQNW